MKLTVTSCALVCACVAGAAGPAWQGEALRGWAQGGHQVGSAVVADGRLAVTCAGNDAHLYSPAFDMPARATDEVVFRAKGTEGGVGELFWMAPGQKPQQRLSCRFDWIGDGAWHEYRVRPCWQGEKRIGKLRLDFPSAGGTFEVERLAVVEGAGGVNVPTAGHPGVAVTLLARERSAAVLEWSTDTMSGVRREKIHVPGDGRAHRHYVALSRKPGWKGNAVLLRVETPPGVSQTGDVALVADPAAEKGDLAVLEARVADAFNRAGSATPLDVYVVNPGAVPVKDVHVSVSGLPAGVRLDAAASRLAQAELKGGDQARLTPVLVAEAPCAFTAQVVVSAKGVPACPPRAVRVEIQPSLGLPKAVYVPEPKPVATDYDIAALYFPGWAAAEAWARVWRACPERKPLLGWYDEANPEVVDWQIKWLVENGIRTLYVDWYWNRGGRHLEHWVKAFQKAKYRRHLKWAMMWANHNSPGSHSAEDQENVTRFWIENYFNTPEYLKIDGKPVVWIWQSENMTRDVKEGGCRRLLEISRDLARKAGYPGIHFITMKWPEADCSPATVQRYKEAGFDMTGIYHFMSPGAYASCGRRYPFSAVARANADMWPARLRTGILPFLVNLSTGWDDRPWNDHCEIYGKNADDFRRICQAAKAFADRTGMKRICLAPINEWGEGSYAEPNAEHGFGFYEAVRETFCTKPAEGWPLNYGPKDVGLGPYDL